MEKNHGSSYKDSGEQSLTTRFCQKWTINSERATLWSDKREDWTLWECWLLLSHEICDSSHWFRMTVICSREAPLRGTLKMWTQDMRFWIMGPSLSISASPHLVLDTLPSPKPQIPSWQEQELSGHCLFYNSIPRLFHKEGILPGYSTEKAIASLLSPLSLLHDLMSLALSCWPPCFLHWHGAGIAG